MNTIAQKQKLFTNWSLALLLPLLLFGSLTMCGADVTPAIILEQIDIAPVWSVHLAGPPELLTRNGLQYVAYFDHDRFLTVAQRELDSHEWKYHRFPVQMGWQTGGHAKLSLALDRQGYIHITCYRRGLLEEPPIPPRPIYYRSVAPHSIDEFERMFMVSEDERTDYPTFITIEGTIYFSFRDGGSGQGDQHFYRYDDNQRHWERVLDTPLIDGRGERSAYVYGGGLPMPGPDGRWHLLWVWRSTPCHSTNHSLSYARTVGSDLTQWESAGGVPVTPPFTIDNTELLVDGTPPGGRLSNPLDEIYEATSLSGFRGKEITEKQIDLLSDDNPAVRYWAILGLRSQNPETLQPFSQIILDAMDDEYPPVAVIASAVAYEMFGNETAAENLKKFCVNENPDISLMVNKAFSNPNEKPLPCLPTTLLLFCFPAVAALGP